VVPAVGRQPGGLGGGDRQVEHRRGGHTRAGGGELGVQAVQDRVVPLGLQGGGGADDGGAPDVRPVAVQQAAHVEAQQVAGREQPVGGHRVGPRGPLTGGHHDELRLTAAVDHGAGDDAGELLLADPGAGHGERGDDPGLGQARGAADQLDLPGQLAGADPGQPGAGVDEGHPGQGRGQRGAQRCRAGGLVQADRGGGGDPGAGHGGGDGLRGARVLVDQQGRHRGGPGGLVVEPPEGHEVVLADPGVERGGGVGHRPGEHGAPGGDHGGDRRGAVHGAGHRAVAGGVVDVRAGQRQHRVDGRVGQVLQQAGGARGDQRGPGRHHATAPLIGAMTSAENCAIWSRVSSTVLQANSSADSVVTPASA
jgi:hypothetical protein